MLWTLLVSGQIQGMVLAHNNPYDVVAGHAIARAAGAICTDYAGAPLTLDSPGAMAAVSRHPDGTRQPRERSRGGGSTGRLSLVHLAEEVHADLLVVGDVGLDTVAGRLLGSVPAEVARRATIDIVIVHAAG